MTMANAPRSRRFSSRLEKSRNKSGAVELLNLPSVRNLSRSVREF